MAKILIIGSNGVVGNDLIRLFNQDSNTYQLFFVNKKKVIQEYKNKK